MEDKEHLKELVARAQMGDEGAFAVLYEEYFTPLYRFLYFRVADQQEAEDLAQATFVKAWGALKRYRETANASFSSWLYAIARNTLIDHWKKKKDVSFGTDEAFNAIIDADQDPITQFRQNDTGRKVREAIQGLSEDQRDVVVMKFIQDMSNKEIAEALGKTEEAVRQLQFRALRMLRSRFREEDFIS
jgi:RNA polymerase sigma-70 factor (ECF subfamily)